MKRLFFFCIFVFFISGCITKNIYVPPKACVQDENGKYNSVILERIPNPAEASLLLQVANLEAVKNNLYSVDKALAAIDFIESLLDNNISFNHLIAEATNKSKDVNSSYGLEIFLISQYVGVLESPEIVSECDKALIQLHLNKQRQMLNLLKE